MPGLSAEADQQQQEAAATDCLTGHTQAGTFAIELPEGSDSLGLATARTSCLLQR